MIGFILAELAASASFKMEFSQQYALPTEKSPFMNSKIANPNGIVNAASNGGTLTGKIGLGTPSQSFDVLIDTGSHIFWIQSSDCKTATCTSSKSGGFNNKISKTYAKVGGEQSLKYADGISFF